MEDKRISFQNLAMNLAISASQRSEDIYQKVGCSIFNKENRLLSLGYNGLSPKHKTNKTFWENRNERRKYIIHAETNALSCITRYDKPYLIATTLLPCKSCAVNIASYGIKKVLYLNEYCLDSEAKEIFNFYKIKLQHYNK